MKLFPVASASGNILLRSFRIEDAVVKTRLDDDPEIRKLLGRPSKLEDDIAEFEHQGYGLVAIVDAATDQIAGYAKLQSPEWEKNLGLELVVAVAPEARRKGFAFEAAQKLIEISCGPLQQKQVVGRVASTNGASLKLVCKLKMKKVGERPNMFDHVQHIFVVSCRDLPDNI